MAGQFFAVEEKKVADLLVDKIVKMHNEVCDDEPKRPELKVDPASITPGIRHLLGGLAVHPLPGGAIVAAVMAVKLREAEQEQAEGAANV